MVINYLRMIGIVKVWIILGMNGCVVCLLGGMEFVGVVVFCMIMWIL